MGKLAVYCPTCGKLFDSEEEMLEHYDKTHSTNEEPPLGQQPIQIEQPIKKAVELLISDEMSDEAIKKKIVEDMMNLQSHEAGTKWMYIGSLLSLNSTDQILASGLKAIIDQNKIIIRQNELMLRALCRGKEKSQ